jgi:hypothetical protein
LLRLLDLLDLSHLPDLPDLLGTSSLKKRTVTEQLIRNSHSHNQQAGVGDGTHGEAS